MTAQELYDLSQSYLMGKDGIPKNEAKGWETMRQAAEAGHEQALKEFALHIAETEPQTAVKFIEKSATAFEDKRFPSLYIRALYKMIGKNTAIASENCKKAEVRFDENTADADTCYYYGKLLQLAGSDKANKYLTKAAIMGCMHLTDSDFKQIGRQKGIITPNELEIWINGFLGKGDFYYDQGRYNYKHNRSVYTVECAKNEGTAKVIVDAQLDEKSTAQKLGKSRVKKMKKLTPTVVLEYQKILESAVTIGNYPFTYRHKTSERYADGTGHILLDTPYSDFATTYRHGVSNDQLNQSVYKYRYSTEKLPANARIRANTEHDAVLETDVKARMMATKTAVETQKSSDLVRTERNWMEKNVVVHFDPEGEYDPQYAFNAIFVPYWFFIYQLKGETVSVRVDAFTGEATFFIDNPYGLYQPGDDVKTGGGSMTEPERPVKFNIFVCLLLACIFPIAGGVLYLLSYFVQKGQKNAKRKKNAV